MELGTVNIYLVVGLVASVVYLLWRLSSVEKLLKNYIIATTYSMTLLDKELVDRDEKVDEQIDKLNVEFEYFKTLQNDKDEV